MMAVQKVEDFLNAVNEEGNKKTMRFEKFITYILVFSLYSSFIVVTNHGRMVSTGLVDDAPLSAPNCATTVDPLFRRSFPIKGKQEYVRH